MGLVDLFRPKWKHSDAEVRAAAIRQLGADNEDILANVAKNDSDAAVRRIAIKKLSSASLLLEIAQADADESLRQIAYERATSLLLETARSDSDPKASEAAISQLTDPKALAETAKNALLDSARRAAISKLTDPKGLADVARNASEPGIRLEALRGISDLTVLKGIALSDNSKEVALAALEKIEDREALEAIAKKSKIKNIRSSAQKKLAGFKGVNTELAPEDIQQTRLGQICRTVESLARSSDWENAEVKIREAQNLWQDIGVNASDELKKRFDEACNAFFNRLTKYQEQQRDRAQHVQELRKNLATRIAFCEKLESLPPSAMSHEKLAEMRAAWEQLPPIPEAQRSVIEQRFKRACESCEQRLAVNQVNENLREQFEQLCQAAEKIVEMRSIPAAKRRWVALKAQWKDFVQQSNAAVDEELQKRFFHVGEQLEKRDEELQVRREQRKQENLKRFEGLCVKLEQLAQTNNARAAERQMRETHALLRKLGPFPSREQEEELRRRYQAAREQLTTRIRELREADDWKRWSNVSKQEELCAQVEALLQEPNLKEVAKKLKQAQTIWKQFGAAPKDKAETLWERFKLACDQAYARCQEYFNQIEAERAENLKKKEALCEQVEALAESTEWDATADKIKQLQAEWKKIGPAPREQSETVWKRFRKACDQFFNRRQDHLEQANEKRAENLKKKEALCEQVEALAESTEWDATADKIKQLQAEWKKIGPVARTKSNAVWRRFRQACDHFFERREQQLDASRSASLTQKEDLCNELESLLPKNEEPADITQHGQIVQQLKDAQAKWKEIGPVPRANSDAIWERFSYVCARLVEAYPDAFQGTEFDPDANLKKKEKLCLQVEALLGNELETGGAVETVEAMAEQLRQALAANALTSHGHKGGTDWGVAAKQVRQLQIAWKKIGPTPKEQGQLLWERFRSACDRVFEKQKQKTVVSSSSRRRPDLQVNLTKKIELCIKAEAISTDLAEQNRQEAVKELQLQWKAIGPVPRVKSRSIWIRFKRACDKVMKSSGTSDSTHDSSPDVIEENTTPSSSLETRPEDSQAGNNEVQP